jgi:ammonia channel protein AmtB
MRKLIIGSLVAATLGAIAVPAVAAHVDLFVDVAPPPARVEVVPAPRAGFVWVPGVWEWRHHHHVWAGGHWVHARAGYLYQPAAWAQLNGRWAWHESAWVRTGPHRGVRVY